MTRITLIHAQTALTPKFTLVANELFVLVIYGCWRAGRTFAGIILFKWFAATPNISRGVRQYTRVSQAGREQGLHF